MDGNLKFIEKYKNDLASFVENFMNIKLNPYQKIILNMRATSQGKRRISSRTQCKRAISDANIEYMKAMEMDFSVFRPEGTENYKKGKLISFTK